MFCVRKERSKGELGKALKVEVRIATEDVNRATHSDDAIRAVLLEWRNARKLVMPRPARAFALIPNFILSSLLLRIEAHGTMHA